MTDEVMEEIERVVSEVEAEIKANPNRTWTIEKDKDGEYVTKCPWCGALDEIHEHDVGVRWNHIRPESKTVGTGKLGEDAEYEADGWVCGSCGTDQLDAPHGFTISEWY